MGISTIENSSQKVTGFNTDSVAMFVGRQLGNERTWWAVSISIGLVVQNLSGALSGFLAFGAVFSAFKNAYLNLENQDLKNRIGSQIPIYRHQLIDENQRLKNEVKVLEKRLMELNETHLG
jgi:hypothetical protein